MTVEVRTATPDDARRIARVRIAGWRAAYPGLVSAEVLAGLDEDADTATFEARIGTEPEVRLLVAGRGATVEGFCTYGPDRDDTTPGLAEIYAIYVDPNAWAAGIGTALMRSTLADLTGRGSQEVRVWALRGNTRAGEFYVRRGFTRVDGGRPVEGLTGPDGADAPEVCFVRALGEG
jgi:ribosomal protein S18 acetylase RimI-like enzyme